ncbi:MAG: FAD-binding protein [Ruminococcaceae bacterium]|nr:FAD-binding protein [Oscillospiraceae bacterium]
MKIYEYDALVIGSGCAGYNAADWLWDLNVKNVAVMTEGRLAGTSRNTGSDKQTYYKLSLAGDEGDSVLGMAETLFSGGAMDGDVALAEAASSLRSFMKLANLGVRFPTNEYGEYVGYKTDHDPYCRATSIGPYTSKKMTEVLEESVMKKGIDILDSLQAIKILTDGGKVTGVLAINTANTADVEYVAVKAANVIIATGGPAAIYKDNVYPVSHTGNSSLALEAGAAFGNLSEWQYGLASTDFRWNVSGTYQQVLPRYISVDKNGVEREFLLDYFDTPMEALKNVFLKGYEWPFDVRKIHGSSYVDLIIYHESVILGREVFMDFRREPTGLENGFSGLDEVSYAYLKNSDALIPLPIERLKKMNPGAISLYMDNGIDITKEPLRVAVCAQHNNGGIRIDSNWQTNVEGLYAAGEVAGSLGIFRPGGTALNSCQVGSLRAAEHIAYRSTNRVSESFDEILKAAVDEANAIIEATRGEKSTILAMRDKYSSRMSQYFAFLRDIPEMKKALGDIKSDIESFANDNKWSSIYDIPHLFKNLDIIRISEAVGEVISYTAESFGSRGSGFVLSGEDFMLRKPIPENACGREKIVTVRKSGSLKIECVDVKPIPKSRDLWFEKVWSKYRALTEK